MNDPLPKMPKLTSDLDSEVEGGYEKVDRYDATTNVELAMRYGIGACDVIAHLARQRHEFLL